MENWNDLRFFLAVARTGTVSAAAEQLRMNQSTVSRHINHFEEMLQVRLFERLTTGYQLTNEGHQLHTFAQRMEKETLDIERLLMGKDIALSGTIRVTAPQFFINFLLMPIFVEFNRKHPDIELQIIASDEKFKITQREADVAIRITGEIPPESLVGRELGVIRQGVYVDNDYLAQYQANPEDPLLWIGEDVSDTHPSWLPNNITPIKLTMRTNDVTITIATIKQGMGVGKIPRMVGEEDSQLVEFPNIPELPIRKMWILTHPDIRNVNRIKTFMEFMSNHIRKRMTKY